MRRSAAALLVIALTLLIAPLLITDRRQLMERTLFPSPDDNTITSSVVIRRPVEQVFNFYRDFTNLPSFLGDVIKIEQIDAATSRWTIQGPFGIQVHWKVRVIEERPNELIWYDMVGSPRLKTEWKIYFAPGPAKGETEVREVMKAPLGRLGRVALALIGKFPAEEVSANLHRFKELMETGKVTDTSYSVAGKFAQQANQHEVKK
jgi:uncharacterized membrane protein